MASRFLGQFLLERTAISMDQLKAAVSLQEQKADASLGARSIAAGFLNQGQVDELSAARKDSESSWLELAAAKGMLSEERVETLSEGVMDPNSLLADALVESGALSTEALEGHLKEFSKDSYGDIKSAEELLEKCPNSKVLSVIADHFTQAFYRTLQVLVTAEKCFDDVYATAPCEYSVYQRFKGDFKGEVHLNLSSALMMRIASKLLMEETPAVNAIVIDGACEFHNIVNGNICAALSEMGIKVDLEPPRYYRHPQWGERSGVPFDLGGRVEGGNFVGITLAHPSETPELCIIDQSAVN